MEFQGGSNWPPFFCGYTKFALSGLFLSSRRMRLTEAIDSRPREEGRTPAPLAPLQFG